VHRIEQIQFELEETAKDDANDPEIQAANQLKVYRELADLSIPGNIAYVVLFIWMVYALHILEQQAVLTMISGFFIILGSILRTYLAHQVDGFVDNLRRWRYLFSSITIMIAMAWAALGVCVIDAALAGHDSHDLLLMSILMFALVSGGMNVLAIIPTLWRVFIVVIMVPMIIGLFLVGTHNSVALGIIMLLGFLFCLNVGKRIHRDYWQRIEHENRLQRQADVLSQARDMALDAVRTKSAFLANMSHEIRTPMNGVLGMASLLQNTPLNGKQQAFVDAIKRSGDSLLRIINDILDFSKIDANKLELEYTPFCLSRLIQDVVELLSQQSVEQQTAVVIELPPQLPKLLLGDRIRFQQVVMNIVSNAIKFTDQGKVTIAVREMSRSDAHIQLHFSISDTGVGIAVKNKNHIFDAFSQSDVSTTRQYGGTGLGLTISKSIVTSMGGDIVLDSELGKGSTFSFELEFPIVHEDAVNSVVWEGLSDHDAIAGQCESPSSDDAFIDACILLVEDNDVNQMITSTMLEELGCRTLLASNGKEAIHAFVQGGIDLILMDCQMPVLDGYDATREIRKLEHVDGNMMRRMPVVALTAHAMRGDREVCLKAGMDDYMSKPFSKEKLIEKLRSHLPNQGKMMVGQGVESADDMAVKGRVLDRAVIDFLPGDSAMLQKVLRMFLKNLPELMGQMKQGLEKGDADQMMRASHTLKSSSAMVGAMALSALC